MRMSAPIHRAAVGCITPNAEGAREEGFEVDGFDAGLPAAGRRLAGPPDVARACFTRV
jgi:hypothetical protein